MNIFNLSSIWTILVGVFLTNGIHGRLYDTFEWNVLKFDTPEDYPVDPNYTGNTTLITGIEVLNDRILIATPRIWPGNPASLSWVEKPNGVITNPSPILHAYPNWDMHRSADSKNVDCNGIISVYRMSLNQCGDLWVLDSGLQSTRPYRAVCPPKILVFDSTTHELIQMTSFPSSMYNDESIMTNILHEASGSDVYCLNSTVYMADTRVGALVMYNPLTGHFWRRTHPDMEWDPVYEEFSLFGDSFKLRDGIVGMDFNWGKHELYFQPFAGKGIFKVPLADLEESANLDGQLKDVEFWVKKKSQSCGLAYGLPSGSVVYSEVSETNLVLHAPESSRGKVVEVSEWLQFVVDLKIRGKTYTYEDVWIASSRLQKFMTQKLDTSEVNLRILLYVPSYHDLFVD